MRKEWMKPVLEVLDVTETMGGTNYNTFDSNFNAGHEIPVNSNGQPLIGS